MSVVIALTVLFGDVLVVAALGHNGDSGFAQPVRGKGERI